MKYLIDSALLNDGYNLSSIGIHEYAWDIGKVMKVIDFLEANRFIILGGDVYCISNKTITDTGDSWYINKNDYKSDYEYFNASITLAKNYILKYKKLNGEDFIYSLVYKKIVTI